MIIRGFVDGSLSRISYNTISRCKSINANSIIGIDIRGDTELVEIIRNDVDETDAGVIKPVYSSLVIGKHVDSGGANTTIRIARNRLIPPPTIHENYERHRNMGYIDTPAFGCPFKR
jgi:hypothetical protein